MPRGRIIVVTGATRGLGRELTARFAARGHTVLGCGRSASRVARLENEHPAPHCFQAVDVADAGVVAAWAAEMIAGHGPPDLVVNNAALMNRQAPLWEIAAEEFGELMDTNVDGTVNVIRAFLPAMIAAGCGVVANLSSGWGRSASPGVAPYCASKFAVEGLTRSLAQELPSPLAAVAVSPGVVDTDMLRLAWGESAASCPTCAEWGPRAAAFFLALGPCDNGRSLTI
jgi:NAD(P)-dependent dehydrogenase (short-subunit alcohol dehydrogenase family)